MKKIYIDGVEIETHADEEETIQEASEPWWATMIAGISIVALIVMGTMLLYGF